MNEIRRKVHSTTVFRIAWLKGGCYIVTVGIPCIKDMLSLVSCALCEPLPILCFGEFTSITSGQESLSTLQAMLLAWVGKPSSKCQQLELLGQLWPVLLQPALANLEIWEQLMGTELPSTLLQAIGRYWLATPSLSCQTTPPPRKRRLKMVFILTQK